MYVSSKPNTTFSQSILPNTLFRNEFAVTPTPAAQPANNTGTNQKTVIEPPLENKLFQDTNLVDIDNYIFQADYPNSKNKKSEKKKEKDLVPAATSSLISAIQKSVAPDTGEFTLPKIRNYETAFSSTYF